MLKGSELVRRTKAFIRANFGEHESRLSSSLALNDADDTAAIALRLLAGCCVTSPLRDCGDFVASFSPGKIDD